MFRLKYVGGNACGNCATQLQEILSSRQECAIYTRLIRKAMFVHALFLAGDENALPHVVSRHHFWTNYLTKVTPHAAQTGMTEIQDFGPQRLANQIVVRQG